MPNGARARPSKANLRPDHNGPQRAQFESNKKKIYATQKVCGMETLTRVIQLCMGLESVGKSQSDHCFPFRRFSNAKPTATRTAPAPKRSCPVPHHPFLWGKSPRHKSLKRM